MPHVAPTAEWKLAQSATNADVREQIKTFDLSVFSERINAVLLQATVQEWREGMAWYTRESESIIAYAAQHYPHISRYQACGLFAATSPNATVPRNWQLYRQVLFNVDTAKCLGSVRDKCRAILAGLEPLDVLGGRKTTAFYLNLSGCDMTAVTVDRHAGSAVYDTMLNKVDNAWYDHASEAYRIVASDSYIQPAQCQAIAWVVWRRMKGLK